MSRWTPEFRQEFMKMWRDAHPDAQRRYQKKVAERRRHDFNTMSPIEARKKHFNTLYRDRIRAKGHVFDITADDVEWPERCPVTGEQMEWGFGPAGANKACIARIDPKLGYVKGNVRFVVRRAVNGNPKLLEFMRRWNAGEVRTEVWG